MVFDDMKDTGRIKPSPLKMRAGLIFDHTKLSVTNETKKATLTLYEWRLLDALIDRQGKVLSYDELGKSMTDDERPRSKNQMRQHMFELREKLANLAPFLRIRNVQNVGYVLEQ